ncbi:ComEC/Rec2 family competence protein [Nitrosophilus alvini]|uniref:ComEC/Rec2 family competence protein n=1 Tax=Nitrosophilus alvini TaxID=2714855 RepID=UPI00190D7A6A|nr:ComEC/Rec2 family competence protein [Nitrosophilus alvini]
MEKIELSFAESFKEISFISLFLFFIFSLSLLLEYRTFLKLSESEKFFTTAEVLNQYPKKDYLVLKLKSKEGFVFYTTSREKLKNLIGRDVDIMLFLKRKRLSFFEYLKNFYAPSYIAGVYPGESFKKRIAEYISSMHEGRYSKELFPALAVASAVSKEFRDKLSALGLSHLVAISGFHLGIISAIVFMIFGILYKPFQNRYFPYRNRTKDIMIAVLFVCGIYLLFLDFIPSLVRAFFMSAVAFYLYDRHIKIFSFTTLFFAVMLILALFPRFIFSVGFWLSVAGIFYIYLFVHYFSHLKKWQIFMALNFWVFFAMIPIVHFWFESFSWYQFLSPFATMLFSVFYPIEIILHISGLADILDFLIEALFSLDFETFRFGTPLEIFIFYIFLSLLSILNRGFFYLLFLFNTLFLIYNVADF